MQNNIDNSGNETQSNRGNPVSVRTNQKQLGPILYQVSLKNQGKTLAHKKFQIAICTHESSFSQRLWHTDTLIKNCRYTDTLAHRDFQTQHTDRLFNTQIRSQLEPLSQKHFYYTRRPLLLHQEAFTHRLFHTQTPLHTGTLTQTLLFHTETFLIGMLYLQALAHTIFFFTQTLFTHGNFYT